MLLKEVAEMFTRECGFDDELKFIGEVGLCFVLMERFKGINCREKVICDLYSKYDEWEKKRGNYSSDLSICGRVFDSVSRGMIAESLCNNGEEFFEDVFRAYLRESGMGNPYYEDGFVGYIRYWLDNNEGAWLHFVVKELR